MKQLYFVRDKSKDRFIKTYTYIVCEENTNLLKIGKSASPKKRIRGISTLSGKKLRIISILDIDVENALHKKFSQLRTIGEWFDDEKGLIRDFVLSDDVLNLQISKPRIIPYIGFSDNSSAVVSIDCSDKGYINDNDRELRKRFLFVGKSDWYYEDLIIGDVICNVWSFRFSDGVIFTRTPYDCIRFGSIEEYMDDYLKWKSYFLDEGMKEEDIAKWDSSMIDFRMPILKLVN